MPTIAEGEYNKLMFNYTRSWTDDLPVCKVSGLYKVIILFDVPNFYLVEQLLYLN